MELLVCDEGFIHMMSGNIENEDPDMEVVDVSYDFSGKPIVDLVYGLPLYRYINGEVIPVASVLEYQEEAKYWEVYLQKVTDEVIENIKAMNNDELKALHDASPDYKKQIIYNQIEIQAAKNVDQVVMNLTFEIAMRVVAEWLYIKEIELREPTADETAGFHEIITTLHTHSSGMGMPISVNSWFQAYFHNVLGNSESLRGATLAKRFYVTGAY